jgi:PAS domain S-box-containing protein
VVADGEALIVADARTDARFHNNPLVTGEPRIAFYAGLPLTTPGGLILGTLCAIDHQPRALSTDQKRLLALLAGQVMLLLESRRQTNRLREKHAELAIRNRFFGLSLDLLCTVDETLTLRELNPAWQTMLGWTPAELRSQPLTAFNHPDDINRTLAEADRLRSGATTIGFENRFKHKNGHWVLLSWIGTFADGMFFAAARDISAVHDKRVAVAAAAEAANLLAAIVQSSTDAIVTKQLNGVVTSWNSAASRLFGYSEPEAVGKTATELFSAESVGEEDALIGQLMRGEHVAHFECTRRRRDGKSIEVSVTLSPLKDSNGKLVGVSQILRDISERKQLDRMQSEFVSTVSHELRTPLTSIHGSLGLLAAGVTGVLPPAAQQYIDIALANSDRLVRLLNDILDVEKMRAGDIEFQFRAVEVEQLVREAVQANQVYAQLRGVRIVQAGTVPPGEILVDTDRLAQVLANLASNAIKFAPEGSQVELSAAQIGARIRLTIRDYGSGVPRAFRSRIFERFAQADGSTTRGQSGTGLGLSISKAIVEKMRGSIGFHDAGGGGTAFFVEFDYLPKVTDAPQPRERLLLVCEDDPLARDAMVAMLSNAGFITHVAPTLERARRLLALHRYAAVTLDLVLADGDGTALIRDIRKAERGRTTPVLVVTGVNRALGAAAVWVSDVLQKPIHQPRLLAAVECAIARPHTDAPRILHIDASADVREITRRSLPQHWLIESAATLQEAKEKLGKHNYDIVLLELLLPDGAGEVVLPLVGDAQVILFTSVETRADLASLVAGALVKSAASLDDVRDRIVDLVRNSAIGDRLSSL